VTTQTRRDAAARTKAALVDAGLRLAEEVGLAGLSANRVVAEAGVSKGTFFHHFRDRASYLVELHRTFHDRLMEEAFGALAEESEPGAARLLKVSNVYLDVCLRQRGVRSLLFDARAEPAVLDEIKRRSIEAAQAALPDFEALGHEAPFESARLWIGMIREAALLEFDAGKKQPRVRAALTRFIA
jgi:AcrR family transcriptional regulator